MTPGGEDLYALEELIAASFTREELERFAERLDPASHLNVVMPGAIASRLQTAHAFVGAAVDRGLLDRRFFDLLIRERPRKRQQIEAIMRTCLPGQVGPRGTGSFADERPDAASTSTRWMPLLGVLLVLAAGVAVWQRTSGGAPSSPGPEKKVEAAPGTGSRIPWLARKDEAKPAEQTAEVDKTSGFPFFRDATERKPDAPTSEPSPPLFATDDPWRRGVMEALNRIRVGAYAGGGQVAGDLKFQLVVCADGKISQVNPKGGSVDPSLASVILHALESVQLPKPPPEVARQLGAACKRLPYTFTWTQRGSTSKVE